MKKFLMMTSAIGLCLAAPAFAQTTTPQDPLNTPRATPPSNTQTPSAQAPAAQVPANRAAPARPRQPQSANTGQQQPAPSGQAQNQQPPASASSPSSAQAPAPASPPRANAGNNQNQNQNQNDRAQNQQQPAASGSSSPSSAQAPAPASPPRANADNNQNQNQNQNQRNRAQNQQPPAASGGSSNNSAQAPADRQRSATPDRNRQSGQADRQQSQSRQPQRDQRQDAQNSRSRDSNAARASASVKVNINDTQRTRIASVIGTAKVRPIDVNFRVETGVVIPATVTLNTLPPTIVEIVPQYRGYRYFVTRDRIVIVEPRKKIIVDVIPLGGATRAQAPEARKLSFTDQQRDIIRRQASPARAPATTGSSSVRIVVEQEVPEAVELQEFPAEIVTEVPVVRTYRYFRQDDDVVVVDPTERRVIEIIR